MESASGNQDAIRESMSSRTPPNPNAATSGSGLPNHPSETQTDCEGASASQPARATVPKKRKQMPPRSVVWSHFTKVTDSNGDLKAKCIYCKKLLSCASKQSGTSSLRALKNACLRRERDNTQSQLIFGQGDLGQGVLSHWKYDEAYSRKLLAYMIVNEELPLKFVEKENFRRYVQSLNPRAHISSRQTIARDIFQQYKDEKLKLKHFLISTRQRVCLTTDTWTSVQNLSYMSLTAHYIDKELNLYKKILNFCYITSHTREALGKAVEDCLLGWGLDRIFTVTVDNASANDVSIDYLKRKIRNWGNGILECKYLHMRCIAHIINLVVTSGLKDEAAEKAIKKIRAAVKYVKKSPLRLAKFKSCVQRAKIESRALLRLDVSTRWNSTYLMLVAAEKFERAFEIYADDDPNFKNEIDDNGGGVLFEGEWDLARKLIGFLEHFYEVTNKVYGSLYVTSNNFFDEIMHISNLLDECCASDDLLFGSMAVGMREKYRKYWGDVEKMNMLIYIACILDPAQRLRYIEFVIGEKFDSDKDKELGKKICAKIKESLNEMFSWYESKFKPVASNVDGEVSSLPSSSSTSESSLGRNKYEMRKKFKTMIGNDENLSELVRYLKEEPTDDSIDVLKWWKINCERFPILSEMARDVLVVPISTVASESAFSTSGRVLYDFRSSLNADMVQTLICLQNWLTSQISSSGIEEEPEDVEELQKEMPNHSIGSTILGVREM